LDFNIDFNLVRSQKLLLIPQLKQALEILEMNSTELFHYIENQLELNPALEEVQENPLADAAEQRTVTEAFEDDQDSQISEIPETTLSLKEHLLIQLNGLCTEKYERVIGEYLIDNTDDNGYLTVDIQEVAAFFMFWMNAF
jgi:RNA polymerase sigma-54 factor